MPHRLIFFWAALLIASPAAAEVADKEPSMAVLWAWALAFNVIALLLALVRRWLGLIVVPFTAFFAWAVHSELSDPFVGPAILEELGPGYVIGSYFSVAFGLLGPLVIVLLRTLARRQKS
jgi:hypothetical protein